MRKPRQTYLTICQLHFLILCNGKQLQRQYVHIATIVLTQTQKYIYVHAHLYVSICKCMCICIAPSAAAPTPAPPAPAAAARLSSPLSTPYRVCSLSHTLPLSPALNSPQFRPSANGTSTPSCILNLNRANATRGSRFQVAFSCCCCCRCFLRLFCLHFNSCANSNTAPSRSPPPAALC